MSIILEILMINCMKRFILILSFVLAGVTAISAQDLIVKKNGEDQQAKILEVGQNEIKYRKWDNLEGPIYSMPVSDILLIRYENGTNEVFNKKTSVPVYNGDANREVSSAIMPGMRYKDYHKLYKASDYVHVTGDRYSPALGGVLSFLIPGLGQMVCGEVGRGFSWFGGAVACSVVMGVGVGLTAGAVSYDYYDEDMAIAGLVLTLAGSISLLSVDIAAIVDGVKVAKIKNMYQRDTREMSSVKLDMSPYFAIAPTGIGSAAPVAGMSLRLSF
jgi:TM2